MTDKFNTETLVVTALSLKLREDFYKSLENFMIACNTAGISESRTAAEVLDASMKLAIAFGVSYNMDEDTFVKVVRDIYKEGQVILTKVMAAEENDLTPTNQGSNSIN